MSHDQTMKELLRAFFAEFLLLFYPDIAQRLDFSRVTFLDKETFTDLPEGQQRIANLVGEVYTDAGQPEIVLIHIEVEYEWRSDFPERMYQYYTLLWSRYRKPIFPVAIYLTSGRGGLVQERFTIPMLHRDPLLFIYDAVGLPDLQADDYLDRDNPLAPALGALMKPSRLGKVAQKYRSLLAMVRSGVDEARLTLLTNVVETYLKLDEEERVNFEALIARPESEEIQMVVSVYEQRGIEKGIEQGIVQGIEQGALQGERKLLLRQMERKFGMVPDEVRARLEAISDIDELDRLGDVILTANSIEEMGL